MKLDSAQDWIAWGGIVIPLLAMAWAAVMFVWAKREEIKIQEYQRLQEVMKVIGEGSSLAPRIAAAYELRNFKPYRDVVVRFCEVAEFGGDFGHILNSELTKTKAFLEGNSNNV